MLLDKKALRPLDGQYVNQDNELYSGEYITYYDSKKKEAIYTLENGLLNGQAQFFHESGMKQRDRFL